MESMLNIKQNPVNIVGNKLKINFSGDDFRNIRELDTCYVDKSKMIEDFLKYDDGKVALFTRPRRFGKSLNLSMMRYFFDMTEASRHLFKGLYMEKSELFEEHLNQYPLLYLNFKNANVQSSENAAKSIASIMKDTLEDLATRYSYEELKNIEITLDNGSINSPGIKKITSVLKQKTGKKVIVLMDEYDNLINKSYGTKDWQTICALVKDIFGALFKSNENLKFAILTGVSRIGKELSFSDMNNLAVYGLTKEKYYDYYGFTEEEVKALFQLYNLEVTEDFYNMYNGYRLGGSSNIFNTSSILKFLDDFLVTGKMNLNSYWVNAATNFILKDNVKKMDSEFKDKLLSMIDGDTIHESLVNSIDYEELDIPEHLFTLLIDTGYLCPIEQVDGDTYEIKIPNKEVLYGYKDMIESIIGASGQILSNLCSSLINGKIEKFETQLNEILLTVSSYHDFSEKENSYHNLLMGALLYLLDTWYVTSNREAGKGRYDIALLPKEVYRGKLSPIIIAFKVPKESIKKREYSIDELEALAEKALEQIAEKQYCTEYGNSWASSTRKGWNKEDFVVIGIGAQGKTAAVKSNIAEEE